MQRDGRKLTTENDDETAESRDEEQHEEKETDCHIGTRTTAVATSRTQMNATGHRHPTMTQTTAVVTSQMRCDVKHYNRRDEETDCHIRTMPKNMKNATPKKNNAQESAMKNMIVTCRKAQEDNDTTSPTRELATNKCMESGRLHC